MIISLVTVNIVAFLIKILLFKLYYNIEYHNIKLSLLMATLLSVFAMEEYHYLDVNWNRITANNWFRLLYFTTLIFLCYLEIFGVYILITRFNEFGTSTYLILYFGIFLPIVVIFLSTKYCEFRKNVSLKQ